MSEKIVGYLLLVAGLFVIIFSGFNVYQVFTKKAQPVALFNFTGVSLDVSNLMGEPEGLTAEQKVMLNSQKSQMKPQEIIPSGMINETSNIAAHLFLMGFVASLGYRIASLGVQMVRPIVVKLKETQSTNQATK